MSEEESSRSPVPVAEEARTKRARTDDEGPEADPICDGPNAKRVKTAVSEEPVDNDKSQKEKSPEVEEKSAGVNGCSKPEEEDEEEESPRNGGSDSDKENVDTPMDLSKGSAKPRPETEEINALSDEEQLQKQKLVVNGLSADGSRESVRQLKQLQDELRNEEAKLVLLKKIRQSQIIQHVQESSSSSSSSGAKAGGVAPSSGGQPARGGHSSSQPPPLVRQQQQQQHMSGQHKPTQSVPPQMQRGSQQSQQHARLQGKGGPPPLIMAPRQHSTPVSNSAQSRSSGSGGGVQRSGGSNMLSGSGYQRQPGSGSSAQQQAPAPPPQPEQTPAQRQAAAKLALRKQLEKTLLQIPPPKPPAPEMNFIPSLAGAEFMMLVGLEEVVKFIVEHDKNKDHKPPEVKYVFNPFVCVQCGADFTPVWKRDKPGSKNVICEQCVTSNQKKALKQEHTNRLKSAFVKALQQEQEIEQRMQSAPATSTTSSSTPGSGSTSGTQASSGAPSSSHSSHHSSRESHSSSQSSHASSAAPMNLSRVSNEQMRQHQNLLQAHQAQLRNPAHLSAMAAFNPRGIMYPFQPPVTMSSGTAKTATELQRQYLLDMIPRSMPGQPGSTVLWRS